MKTIAIVAKPHAENITTLVPYLLEYLKIKGVTPLLEERTASVLHTEPFQPQGIREKSDMIIVLGVTEH